MHTRRSFLAMAAAAPLASPLARAAANRSRRTPGAAPNRLPDVLLQTHDGRDVHFYNDLVKGRLVVLNMRYANCANICPPNTANLLRVQETLGGRIGRDVFMYSLTLQPAIDKPADLRRYMDKYGPHVHNIAFYVANGPGLATRLAGAGVRTTDGGAPGTVFAHPKDTPAMLEFFDPGAQRSGLGIARGGVDLQPFTQPSLIRENLFRLRHVFTQGSRLGIARGAFAIDGAFELLDALRCGHAQRPLLIAARTLDLIGAMQFLGGRAECR